MTFGFLEEITGYSVCERCIVACSAVESIDAHVASLDTHESLVYPSTPSVCFTHILEDQLSSKQKDEKREETQFL